MVSPTLTTLGVKRKLDDQAPERRSREVTEAIDIWIYMIYMDLSLPWYKRSIGMLLAEVRASEIWAIS
jgi:hypothetical protein